MNHDIELSGHTYRILLKDSVCHACQSLKARYKVSEIRNERVARMNKYPRIRSRKDFMDYVMEVLFNQINSN